MGRRGIKYIAKLAQIWKYKSTDIAKSVIRNYREYNVSCCQTVMLLQLDGNNSDCSSCHIGSMKQASGVWPEVAGVIANFVLTRRGRSLQ